MVDNQAEKLNFKSHGSYNIPVSQWIHVIADTTFYLLGIIKVVDNF